MKHPASFTWPVLALMIQALTLGCSSILRPEPAPMVREYPGTLVHPSTIAGDFLARQEVRGHYGEKRIRFRSILQKRGDTLTLLGMTPFGTRAFLLQQEGTEVTFTRYVDQKFPFPPKYILFDIHRALFIGIAPDRLADGEHAAHRDGEEIRERWRDGRLLERTFRRDSGQPPGLIRITYEDWTLFGVPPRKIMFRNDWFGYELAITTHSYEPLAPPR